jgi:hypothetical protein
MNTSKHNNNPYTKESFDGVNQTCVQVFSIGVRVFSTGVGFNQTCVRVFSTGMGVNQTGMQVFFNRGGGQPDRSAGFFNRGGGQPDRCAGFFNRGGVQLDGWRGISTYLWPLWRSIQEHKHRMPTLRVASDLNMKRNRSYLSVHESGSGTPKLKY